ncbi:glyoxysomal processing protease, glyoxysomal [Salvia miltiorrhiza]|uniref:glyoxysomal processing protease, glyoxysomal n=1 Tax=Salvia miltiorrhiza TaxID=226208 RepID=UPI0025AD0E10|nr:glyoxysomal processing protease, glyoxysomal [Salvia miltiorrhiza]XP_057764471.1 glyoxysomal processing protease, glyoxysomal [Salvia miltiorrhiza]
MGLPEVAEFARNFAVMVRVQGPDPKGLKMRNHAFHHYNSGKTMLSASGTIFPASSNLELSESILVLTVASVIEPFVSQLYQESISEKKPRLIPGVQIDILMEDKSMVDGNMESLPWLPAQLLKMLDIPHSSAAVRSLIEASCGSPEHSWEVGWSLASHGRGPQHIDSSHEQVEQSPFQNHLPIGSMGSSSPNVMGQSATRIALLAVPSKFSAANPLKVQRSIPKRGNLLLAMGSPFGILSPLHFFNNISVGSIGNSYPPSSSTRSLLMADIRCLPGMEGSPVFSEQAQFIGLLTRPLRQKISGTEVQMVIPWEAIASACSELMLEKPHSAWDGVNYSNQHLSVVETVLPKDHSYELPNHSHEQIHFGSRLLSPVEKAMSSICLITTDDGSWASGVLLNKQGLVLTNAHLLEPWRFGKTASTSDRNERRSEVSIIPNAHMRLETFNGEKSSQNLVATNLKAADISLKNDDGLSQCSLAKINHRNIRVRLDFMDPWIWTDARIVYVSKGPLDVALLQLAIAPGQLCPISFDVDCPASGSEAYVIGHGLFGPRCDFLPSACLGVIAKVIEAARSPETRSSKLSSCEQFPAMLETTAAVHPGSSGGAVVNSNGCMIGLVTSNAKHGGGTVIPHLNFSIPCAALKPILKFSEDMQNLTVLEELDKPNEHLSSIWALMPPVYPKPEPIPDILKFPAEDNGKGTKGSRFAKFIADRNELLKTTAQHGIPGRFSTDLIPSKL